LNFLDVKVCLSASGFITCVGRKPTNTGILLNFNALCPQIWKSGLILCLRHRAKTNVLHMSCTWKKLNACAIFVEKMVIQIGFSTKLYVSFRNDATIPLAMKNMKKIFFSRLVYLTVLW